MHKVKISKKKLWQAIRNQCLECVNNSSEEVKLCTSPKCSLYDYRFGRPLKKDDVVYLGDGKYGRI